jgi:hypothetical protein
MVGQTVPLTITMAPQIPTGYSGGWATSAELDLKSWRAIGFNESVPSPDGPIPNNIWPMSHTYSQNGSLGLADWSSMYTSWTSGSPLKAVHGCPEIRGTKCMARIRAPAFAVTSCSSESFEVNYTRPQSFPTYQAAWSHAWPLQSNAFYIDFMLSLNQSEKVVMISAFSDTKNCVGQLKLNSCILQSAIGEYDVVVENNVTTLLSPESPKIIALSNNTIIDKKWEGTTEGHPSSLGGLVLMAWFRWLSQVVLWPMQGSVQATAARSANLEFTVHEDFDPICTSFKDPRSVVMASLNEMMVWGGYFAAQKDSDTIEAQMDPGLKVHSYINGTLGGMQDVYTTDFRFFTAAALVELVCISFVLPTFFGCV